MNSLLTLVYLLAFVIVAAFVMRAAARRSVLWASAAAIGLGAIFFTVVFPGLRIGSMTIPGIAMFATGRDLPLPVPGFAFWTYMILIGTGVLLVVSASEATLTEFTTPIRKFLAGDVESLGRRLRAPLLFGALPLTVALLTFKGSTPSSSPPVMGRQAHPSIPYDENLENPLRRPSARTWKGKAESADAFREDMTQKGRHLYAKNCSPCHGGKADGRGHLARALTLPPANFTDPGTIATLVEAYAFKRIEDGGVGLPSAGTPWDSAMPRWKGELTDEEIYQVLLAEYDLAGVTPRIPEKLE